MYKSVPSVFMRVYGGNLCRAYRRIFRWFSRKVYIRSIIGLIRASIGGSLGVSIGRSMVEYTGYGKFYRTGS